MRLEPFVTTSSMVANRPSSSVGEPFGMATQPPCFFLNSTSARWSSPAFFMRAKDEVGLRCKIKVGLGGDFTGQMSKLLE